jgi:hypothetical protein
MLSALDAPSYEVLRTIVAPAAKDNKTTGSGGHTAFANAAL